MNSVHQHTALKTKGLQNIEPDERLATTSIKAQNRHAIISYIYHHRHVTKQNLERELSLSLPTISANLHMLERQGFITRGAFMPSTGGRKAQCYEFVPTIRIAIGVTLREDHVAMCAIDLHGTVIAKHRNTIAYATTDTYFKRIGGYIRKFAETLNRPDSLVLGVAFSVQGLVSADGTIITYGNILRNTGLTLQTIAQAIDLPCLLIHDSDAAAMSELWSNPQIRDAVCIYLERRPGGAIVVDGKLHQGHSLHNGTIEHMTLVPDGRQCYCGQRGCMDTYCSTQRLIEDDFSCLQAFFTALRNQDKLARSRFDIWLDYLARAIVNIRCVLDSDIIIGGEASHYLNEKDIDQLRERVGELSPFGGEDCAISTSMCETDQNIIGAALRFVEPYIAQL